MKTIVQAAGLSAPGRSFALRLGGLMGLTGGLALSVAGFAGFVEGPLLGALAGIAFAAGHG